MIDRKNFYINGQWIVPKSPKEIQVIDPATEKVHSENVDQCSCLHSEGPKEMNI